MSDLWDEQKRILERNLDIVRKWIEIDPSTVNRHVIECVKRIDAEIKRKAQLAVLPNLNAPEPEEKCNHCHTVWGKGAEKMGPNRRGGVDVCSKCWYSQ